MAGPGAGTVDGEVDGAVAWPKEATALPEALAILGFAPGVGSGGVGACSGRLGGLSRTG